MNLQQDRLRTRVTHLPDDLATVVAAECDCGPVQGKIQVRDGA